MVVKDLDEVLDQLYIKIRQFIITEVGEDLDQDLIDINLETTENGELIVSIDLYLELSPFSSYDVQRIAEEAIKYGIKEADQILPSYKISI
ncbi:MAG: DUF3194 domain-containing protein [Promethearchaeota archaeon]